MRNKAGKITGIVLMSLIGFVSVILIGAQIFLNTQKMKELVIDIASEYVDGEINLEDLEISLFKNFPNLNLSMKDFSLTYPHDQFSQFDRKGPQNRLRRSGRGEVMDTLAAFSRLSVSINYIQAITGRFIVHEACLDSARIHLHCYDSVHTNLSILRLPESEEEEDTVTTIPPIILKKIALQGHPEIVLTAPQDSLFASFSLEEAIFDGKFCTELDQESILKFHLADLMATAQLAGNQTEFSIAQMELDQKEKEYYLDAEGDAFAAIEKLGKIDIPISLKMSFNFPDRNLTAFSFKDFELGIAPIGICGEGDVRLYEDSTYVRGELQISECKVDETIHWLGESILPDLLKIKTDAKISLTALCDGLYIPSKKILPPLLFEFVVPKSKIEYEGLDKKGILQTSINAETDDYGTLQIHIDELKADLAGIYMDASGGMEDVLGADPLISVSAQCRTSLDTLMTFLPDSLGLEATGSIDGKVEGMLFLSDMDFYNFAGADLSGQIRCDSIQVAYAPMDLQAYLKNTRLSLKPTDEKLDKKISLGGDIQALYAEIDSVYAQLGESQVIRGKNLTAIAQNAASVDSKDFGKEYHPIIAQVSADALVAKTAENTFMGVINSKNTFKLSSRKSDEISTPILSADSDNEKIILRQGQGRVGLSNVGFNTTAIMEKDAAVRKMQEKADTSAIRIPVTPDLMQLAGQYLNDWLLFGSVHLENGFLATPYFPLRNHIEKMSGRFNNNEINLENLTIHSGQSDISAQGKVSNIQKAITEKGTIKMDLNVNSNQIDVNELLAAFDAGSKFIEETDQKEIQEEEAMDEDISDEEYISQITKDSLNTQDLENFQLLIPDNVEARINLSANEISYSDLKTDWTASEIAIQNKCLQITNTLATSNMGDIYFEGFYSTEDEENLKAGFDLNMASITADKVITLFPAVDSLMPMLKSFKGILDCELAAVSDMDADMNIKTNSINGVMKIKGKDLSLDNVGPLKKLAKVLMFKNKETGMIDDMSVEGLIKNDELQIFPFVMKIDRYQFAASGIQQFDQNFKYHVSILKSPLPFRFGINLKGNFDDWNFRLGKAKYKNAKVPVFTTELNSIQLNLVNSIHDIFNRGVDLAIRQAEQGSKKVEEEKEKIGLNLEEETEELSIDEQIEMEGAIIENELKEDVEEVTEEVEKSAEKVIEGQEKNK